MGVMEKIKEIEAEMARTQKNKATNVSFRQTTLPYFFDERSFLLHTLRDCMSSHLIYSSLYSITWVPSRPSWRVFGTNSLSNNPEVEGVGVRKDLAWRGTEM